MASTTDKLAAFLNAAPQTDDVGLAYETHAAFANANRYAADESRIGAATLRKLRLVGRGV